MRDSTVRYPFIQTSTVPLVTLTRPPTMNPENAQPPGAAITGDLAVTAAIAIGSAFRIAVGAAVRAAVRAAATAEISNRIVTAVAYAADISHECVDRAKHTLTLSAHFR